MNTHAQPSHLSTGLITLIICGSLAACGGAAAPQQGSAPEVMPAAAPMEKSTISTSDAANVAERMIVRNADLSLVVDDVQAKVDAMYALAKKYGGFVVSTSVNRYDGNIRGNASLRVDSDKLDAVLADLRALAIEVRSESSSGQDVTGEYVDLQAQLTNLEAAEKQLQKIMQESTKTDDVLNVFNQLTQIRGQIEQTKGRMKFLSESAALSLINVELISDVASKEIEIPVWRPLGTAKTALDALVNSLKGLADFLIYFVIAILPVLLLVGLPIVIVVRLIQRITRSRKPAGLEKNPAKTNAANEPKAPTPPTNAS